MPPRQSARLTAKLQVALENVAQTSQSEATNTTPAPTTKPSQKRPLKKQKVSGKAEVKPAAAPAPVPDDFRKVRGRRGALKTMTEMPVDILLEIFRQVEPIDLLHLSRATKDLRAMIIDRNAAFLWEQVYRNISGAQPPACPPGMNIIHYTNLLYGRHCNFCASNQGKVVHWTARARLCHKCAPKQLILWRARQEKATSPADPKIRPLCSSSFFGKTGGLVPGNYVLKAEHDYHRRKLKEIQSTGFKLDYEKVASKESQERFNLSHALSAWHRARKLNDLQAKQAIIDNRRNAIAKKVKEEGYEQELGRFGLSRLPGVKVASELTDKAWERIKPDIIELLETSRQAQRRAAFIQRFSTRIYRVAKAVDKLKDNLPKPPIIAPTTYFAKSEPFCSVLRDLSLNETQVQEQVDELASQIPATSAAWRTEADDFLRGLIQDKGDSEVSATSVDPLELAMTFFKCRWCNDPISYPRILMHYCLRNRRRESTEEGEEEDKVDEEEEAAESDDDDDDDENSPKHPTSAVAPVTPEGVWDQMSSWYASTWNEVSNNVFLDEEASGFANAIINACGEDPKTTTFPRMMELDSRLECVRCSDALKPKPKSRLVMNWRTAILHDIEVHYEHPPTENGWRLLTDEVDLASVKQCEAKLSGRWKAPDYTCRHCNSVVSAKKIGEHMQVRHGRKGASQLQVDSPEVAFKGEFYLPLDIPMKAPPYAVKI